MAKRIVADGEGASKFVSVNVLNAKTFIDAKNVAFSIANSPLVKTAIAGEDPNWGRIIMAIGKTDVQLNLNKLAINFGKIKVIEKGEPVCKILYESKKTKGWSSKWLDKLQEDMTDSKAIVGMLFSVTVPKSFNKDDLYQHTGNIFVCRYDYIILKILAQTQRHLLTQLHKERGNGKENALSAFKFFDNPDVKNIITQMIVKHSAVKNKIKKTIKLAQETEETVDDVSLNLDEFFNQVKKIGIDYFSQKKAEEDEK